MGAVVNDPTGRVGDPATYAALRQLEGQVQGLAQLLEEYGKLALESAKAIERLGESLEACHRHARALERKLYGTQP